MISFIAILSLLLPVNSKCNCHPVKPNQTSHGANEFKLLGEIKVNKITGKVLLPNAEDPVEEAIIEVGA